MRDSNLWWPQETYAARPERDNGRRVHAGEPLAECDCERCRKDREGKDNG